MTIFSRLILVLAVSTAALAAAPAAAARGFGGVVSHVTDGDTLRVRPDGGGPPRAVRLQGIDAPEICQAHGVQAREALAARVLHQRVTVDTRAIDSWRRTLAVVSLEQPVQRGPDRRNPAAAEPDLGAWMVGQGHAWSPRFRGRLGPYAPQEAQARGARLGLWAGGTPVEPRVFRKEQGSCYRDRRITQPVSLAPACAPVA